MHAWASPAAQSNMASMVFSPMGLGSANSPPVESFPPKKKTMITLRYVSLYVKRVEWEVELHQNQKQMKVIIPVHIAPPSLLTSS